jgi:polysaccharide biosynthesis transport protein
MSTSDVIQRRRSASLQSAPGSGEFDLKRVLRSVRRRIHVVVAMLVLGIVLGGVAQGYVTPHYTSSVAILIDPKRPGSYGADETFANLFIDSNKIASVQEILVSSVLLRKVVRAKGLAGDPEFGGAPRSLLRSWIDLIPGLQKPLLPNTPEATEERALERLTQATKTTRVGATYVITLSVTTLRPDLARDLAQGIVDTYFSDQLEVKYAAAQRDADWLSEQLEQERSELIRSERAVEDIREKYGLAQTASTSGATLERETISGLNAQLEQAVGEVAARAARYQEALRAKQTGKSLDSLPEVASSKIIQLLRQQQLDLNRIVAEFRTHYPPNYPGRIRAEESSKELDAQIAAELDRIVDDGLQMDVRVAVARRDALQKQLNDLVRNVDGGKSAEGRVKLREAERVAEANRVAYDGTLAHLREVRQQQSRQEVEARVISPAFKPAPPSSVLFLGAGGGVGLIFGFGLAMLLPLMERRVVSAVDLEQAIGLPVLAMVPLIKRSNLTIKGRCLTIAEYLAQMQLSLFAESLRSLRTSLSFAHERSPRVVQFTSATVGEGKSTIASSMAISAAIAGIRTVLVDLDFYNPSVAGTFGLTQREGAVDVLLGRIASHTALQTHANLPLRIISTGSAMQPLPDVVESSSFKAFIEALTQQFDLVVLDTPPVLAVSNPIAISRVADATVLTVAWRKTKQEDVKHAAEVLRAAGAPLAGIVLNKTDLAKVGRHDGKRYRINSYYKSYGSRAYSVEDIAGLLDQEIRVLPPSPP